MGLEVLEFVRDEVEDEVGDLPDEVEEVDLREIISNLQILFTKSALSGPVGSSDVCDDVTESAEVRELRDLSASDNILA